MVEKEDTSGSIRFGVKTSKTIRKYNLTSAKDQLDIYNSRFNRAQDQITVEL